MKNMATIVCSSLVLLCLTSLVKGQVIGHGQCPGGIETQPNFDAVRYVGKWWEHSKYPFIFELGGKCIQANYGLISDSSISVLNRQIFIFTGQETKIEGSAQVVGNGKLSVTFPSVPFGSSPYWILGTDYFSYAVVYSCNEIFGVIHTTVVWILTRDINPSKGVLDEAYGVLDRQGISRSFLINTDFSGCDNF